MISQESQFIFKLRHNIYLEGDVTLAEMELKAFLPGSYLQPVYNLENLKSELPEFSKLQGLTALDAYVREVGTQGYRAFGSIDALPNLIRRVSFMQNIYCITQISESVQEFIHQCKQELGSVFECISENDRLIIYAVPHYALVELSDVVAKRAKNIADTKDKLQYMLEALLDRNTSNQAIKIAEEALHVKSTTSHLSHDIHYYKAKFFPRLVRSTLNICSQRFSSSEHQVIDCFCGSGTTLLESAMLGMPSVGIDIDPLSVMIAQSKIDILQVSSFYLNEEVNRLLEILDNQGVRQLRLFDVNQAQELRDYIAFPTWLMKNRNMTQEVAEKLISDIHYVNTAVATCDAKLRNFFRVLMSDAISRKIKMRFLGTGVGRFSLTFAKRCISDSFKDSAQKYVRTVAASEWLKEKINLTFSKAQSVHGDARNVDRKLGDFDILLTSPPYLPAASGRESYAKARAPSLIALGIKTQEDIDYLVDESIGSMIDDSVDLTSLDDKERHVVEWLSQDELRSIKSYPTARYFLEMRQAFKEMYQYLAPGALAVIASGKQSTFYQFSTRQELYVVQSAEILAEQARKVGFEVEALHDVQLQKANRNARPRSLDDYHETLICLRKS